MENEKLARVEVWLKTRSPMESTRYCVRAPWGLCAGPVDRDEAESIVGRINSTIESLANKKIQEAVEAFRERAIKVANDRGADWTAEEIRALPLDSMGKSEEE